MAFSKRQRFGRTGRGTGLMRLNFSQPLVPDPLRSGWRLQPRQRADGAERATAGDVARWEGDGGAPGAAAGLRRQDD